MSSYTPPIYNIQIIGTGGTTIATATAMTAWEVDTLERNLANGAITLNTRNFGGDADRVIPAHRIEEIRKTKTN